jgi:hypothetical protein
VLDAPGEPYEAHLLRDGGHVPGGSEWLDIARWLREFLLHHLAAS